LGNSGRSKNSIFQRVVSSNTFLDPVTGKTVRTTKTTRTDSNSNGDSNANGDSNSNGDPNLDGDANEAPHTVQTTETAISNPDGRTDVMRVHFDSAKKGPPRVEVMRNIGSDSEMISGDTTDNNAGDTNDAENGTADAENGTADAENGTADAENGTADAENDTVDNNGTGNDTVDNNGTGDESSPAHSGSSPEERSATAAEETASSAEGHLESMVPGSVPGSVLSNMFPGSARQFLVPNPHGGPPVKISILKVRLPPISRDLPIHDEGPAHGELAPESVEGRAPDSSNEVFSHDLGYLYGQRAGLKLLKLLENIAPGHPGLERMRMQQQQDMLAQLAKIRNSTRPHHLNLPGGSAAVPGSELSSSAARGHPWFFGTPPLVLLGAGISICSTVYLSAHVFVQLLKKRTTGPSGIRNHHRVAIQNIVHDTRGNLQPAGLVLPQQAAIPGLVFPQQQNDPSESEDPSESGDPSGDRETALAREFCGDAASTPSTTLSQSVIFGGHMTNSSGRSSAVDSSDSTIDSSDSTIDSSENGTLPALRFGAVMAQMVGNVRNAGPATMANVGTNNGGANNVGTNNGGTNNVGTNNSENSGSNLPGERTERRFHGSGPYTIA